jgi:ankyrin repeat protein
LIRSGGLEAKDDEGRTPLHIAVIYGQLENASQLLNAGANIDARDNDQQTPLSLAACYETDQSIVELLIKKRADVDALDRWGATPVFWAAFRDYDSTFKSLRDAEARVDLRDNENMTLLHWCAKGGTVAVKIPKLVLDADRFFELNAQDDLGWTPLFWAAIANKVPTMELLIANDADKNATDRDRRTALSWAVEEGQLRAVQYLIDRRARRDIRDSSGKIAQDYAKDSAMKRLFTA